MRFKLKESKNPALGDVKQKVKFLFFPLILENEFRWLEFVKIKYVYTSYVESYDMGAHEGRRWSAVAWLSYDPVKDCDIYKSEKGCAHVDGMICNIEECN